MKKIIYLKQKKITPFLLIAGIVLSGILSIPVKAQYSPWTQKADMPTARLGLVAVALNDSIYAIGGYEQAGSPAMGVMEVYDPATETWAVGESMPTKRFWMAASPANNKIYVFGGYTYNGGPGLPLTEEYDPVTKTWTTKSDMPTPRLGAASCVVDELIYVIGGALKVGVPTTAVEVYDPLTDTWEIKTGLPTARFFLTTSVVDGKIYAIGGTTIDPSHRVSIVEEYDPATDTWRERSNMPTSRWGVVSGTTDEKIYVFGGATASYSLSNVEEYNPALDKWEIMEDMPLPRIGLGACVYNEEVYIVGGSDKGINVGHPGITRVEAYNPRNDLTGSVDQLYLNRCFAEAGNDSVCISTKVNDPTGLTLFAAIESPDQTTIDSLELFDDGLHNDGEAGDTIFANVWPLDSDDEMHYFVNLHVAKEGEETVIHHMNHMASFSSSGGPVVFEGISYSSSDSVPNPGDLLKIKVSLRNESSLTTAPNVRVKISSTDPMVNVLSDSYFRLGDIESKSISTTFSYISIKIADDCPVTSEIIFTAEIMSEDISYCNENFTIQVVDPVSSANEHAIHYKDKIELRNYPNPFNQTTSIQFNLTESGIVTLRIYDFLGREVETLISDFLNTGDHSVELNAAGLAEGIYFCRLETGMIAVTQRMVLVR